MMDLWTKDEFEERLIASLLMITSGTYCGISGRKGSSKENSNGMESFKKAISNRVYIPYDEGEFILNGVSLAKPAKRFSSTISYVPGCDALGLTSVEFVNQLPKNIIRTGGGEALKTTLNILQDGEVRNEIFYLTLTKDGVLHNCLTRMKNGYIFRPTDKRGDIDWDFHDDEMVDGNHPVNRQTLITAMHLQSMDEIFEDWCVIAKTEGKEIGFGITKEHIKSLFYAMSTPLTRTGRHSPILHWVSSHRRRMRSGTDLDVKKHLRGATAFTWEGIRFEIIEPVKRSQQ
ncbi:hypothetical protein [Klebsiella quasipneumoniae]|uniref:hypothetical protein n=1 Tax=Klebsiella quasipneumoniae TaxID=1463165 RepID=UPI001D127470|nr:hypothetical protein [Klebsiella quasipneumoniae]